MPVCPKALTRRRKSKKKKKKIIAKRYALQANAKKRKAIAKRLTLQALSFLFFLFMMNIFYKKDVNFFY